MTSEEIRAFVQDLNACWQRGDLDALNRFYHPDVVLLPPDLGPTIRGREAVVASYREFLEAAELERFQVAGMQAFSFPVETGATHMVHLTFRIDYRLDGERYAETGLEIYTLLETPEGPQIIWRQQAVLDSRLAEKSEPG